MIIMPPFVPIASLSINKYKYIVPYVARKERTPTTRCSQSRCASKQRRIFRAISEIINYRQNRIEFADWPIVVQRNAERARL